MTHRFVGVAGKQFSGDRARAQELTGLARILVQQCVNEIGHRGGLGQAYRIKKLPDGSTIHVTVIQNLKGIAPIVRAQLFAPQPYTHKPLVPAPHYWLATVWVPEGFVITPRNAEAPQGWGFPKRHHLTGQKINPPFGTAKTIAHQRGCVRVMINKFENNKYLDHPDFIVGLERDGKKAPFKLIPNPALRDPVVKDNFPVAVYPPEHPACFYPPYITWPQYYEPVDQDPDFWDNWHQKPYKNINIPGVNVWLPAVDGNHTFEYYPAELDDDGKPLWRQFDENGNDLIYEPESSQWFAHWPEELLYPSDAHEEIFQYTNVLRVAVDRQRVHRQIRGSAHPAAIVLQENAIAKIMEHDSESFRNGYKYAHQRVCSSLGRVGFGENLQWTSVNIPLTRGNGLVIAEGWEHSPGHYANMIDDRWDRNGHLDIGLLRYGYIIDDNQITKAVHSSQLFNDNIDSHINLYGTPTDEEYQLGVFVERPLTPSGFASAGSVYAETSIGIISWTTAANNFLYTISDFVYGLAEIYYKGMCFKMGTNDLSGPLGFIVLGATGFIENGNKWIRVVLLHTSAHLTSIWDTGGGTVSVCKFMPASSVQPHYDFHNHEYFAGYNLEVESSHRFYDKQHFKNFTRAFFSTDGRHGRFSYINTNGEACGKEDKTDGISIVEHYHYEITDGIISEVEVVRHCRSSDTPVPMFYHYRDDNLVHWTYVNVYRPVPDDKDYHEDSVYVTSEYRHGILTSPSGKVYDLGNFQDFVRWVVYLDIEHDLLISAKGEFEDVSFDKWPNRIFHRLKSIAFYFEEEKLSTDYIVREYENDPIAEDWHVIKLWGDRALKIDEVGKFIPYKLTYESETDRLGTDYNIYPAGARASIVHYKGEYIWQLKFFRLDHPIKYGFFIVINKVTDNPRGVNFWGSSLNLEQLTGMSNIEDIYPIGVI